VPRSNTKYILLVQLACCWPFIN